MSEQQPQQQVLIQKIYRNDASCEVPKAPQIFTKPWKPDVDVQIGTATHKLDGNTHVVELTVTVTAKLEGEVAFLIEVKQAGIFEIKGVDEAGQLKAVLGGYCPGILFPFLREAVADLVQRAGFPQLLLQPMNFEALYQQHVVQAGKDGKAEQTAKTAH